MSLNGSIFQFELIGTLYFKTQILFSVAGKTEMKGRSVIGVIFIYLSMHMCAVVLFSLSSSSSLLLLLFLISSDLAFVQGHSSS